MNRFYCRYFIFLLLFFPAAFVVQGQQIPQEESSLFVRQIRAAVTDTAKASALVRYGDFLIDYHKDSAIKVLQRAIALEGPNGRRFTLGKGYLLLGVAYAETAVYAQAKEAYENAVRCFAQGQYYTDLAKAYNNLGNLYNMQGLMEEAVSNYLQALQIAEKQGGNLNLPVVFNNIAAGLQKLGQHQKALYYCNRGEAEARQKKDSLALTQLLVTKSAALLHLGKEAAGKASIHEAFVIARNIDFTIGKAVALTNLADFYYDRNRFDSSLYYLQQAQPWAEAAGDPYYLDGVYYGLGKTRFALKQYTAAVKHLLQARTLALQSGDKEYLAKIWNTLSQVYAAQGRYAQSLEALQRSNRYADSLQNETVSRQVNGLETRFRTAEKDKALAQQQLRLVQQSAQLKARNTALLLALGGLAAVCVISVLGYRTYRQQQRLQAQRLVTLEKEKEAAALHALMAGEEKERIRMARELHDGVGSELSAARMYLEHLGTSYPELKAAAPYQEVLSLVEGAAVEIRKTAHNLLPELLHRHGLSEAVQTFCSKIGNSNTLEVEFQCCGSPRRFTSSFELMAYRVVQELLHNALRHAQATHVLVQLSFENDLLSLTVEDNGIGFDRAAAEKSGGMGLSSLQTRIKAFGGSMDMDTATGRGTAIYITFPLHLQSKAICL